MCRGVFTKRIYLLIFLLLITMLVVSTAFVVSILDRAADQEVSYYTYTIVNTYDHDESAFTQGLVYDEGTLYESTGLYGFSTLRRVDLESGEVLQSYTLPDTYFGEGITICDNSIIQLTWLENKGFVYDKHSFELLREFNYPSEGWGLTYDGNRCIMSDGSAYLFFLDPLTFESIGQVEVLDATTPVSRINELEYVNGKVYANIWMEDKIAIINPQNGKVEGWIDLDGLRNLEGQSAEEVLNGIAYDAVEDRLFVTGKKWSNLFEIELKPAE